MGDARDRLARPIRPVLLRRSARPRARSQETIAAHDQSLYEVVPIVRATLRRKTGMSLVEDDARRDNLDAIELYHDVLTRVWERLRSGESVTENIGDLQGYAAAIT